MENKKIPLSHWYFRALNNQDIHTCTTLDLSRIRVEELFDGHNCQKFIRQYFEHLTATSLKNESTTKFANILNKITEFRAQHTVASFLLGIAVKEKLSLDVRDWIRIYDPYSSDPSFGFFWSLICLTHDVAYYYERNSNKLLPSMRTIEDFCAKNNIHYNLLDYSNKQLLIQQYYLYRSEQDTFHLESFLNYDETLYTSYHLMYFYSLILYLLVLNIQQYSYCPCLAAMAFKRSAV